MASIVPSKDVEAIQWFQAHLSVWSGAAVSIGTSVSAITAFTVVVKAASDALEAQTKAKETSKAATTTFHNNVAAMRANGADIIQTIKAFAETTNNPNVYGLAQLPMPQPPTPLPAPGQPTNFKVELTGSGAVQITWKATNSASSSGVFFTVKRKLASDAAFVNVGTVGAKKFTDTSILQGTTSATYLVQGFRGLLAGEESEQLSVQFGVSAGGGAVQQLKMAA